VRDLEAVPARRNAPAALFAVRDRETERVI
jgi:hypothetical protein